jgi:hypothetical protein
MAVLRWCKRFTASIVIIVSSIRLLKNLLELPAGHAPIFEL